MALPPSVCEDLRLMLLGHCGVGKSATANAILGKETFKETETIQCELQSGRVEGRNISVIDTPGINNTSLTTEQWRSELKKGLVLSSPGPHVFLLVTKVGKFSEEERNAVKWIGENFGEEALKFSMVLFIGREEMTNRQWVKFLEDARTKDLISSCDGRYYVINSKKEVIHSQIIKLLEDIEAVVQQNAGRIYTQEMYEAVDRMRKTEVTQKKEKMRKGLESKPKPNQDTDLEVQKDDAVIEVNVKCGNVMHPKEQEESVKSLPERKGEMEAKVVKETFRRQEETRREKERKKWEEKRGATGGVKPDPAMERRIVLLGKTGSGKSSTGNTILRDKYFDVKFCPALVTKKCVMKEVGRIRVVDTPGLLDTSVTKDQLKHKIAQCMSMSVPGPHVFLLVIKLGRFTEEEKNAVRRIQEIFGEDASRYTIVLFTHADQLGERTLEKFLAESPDLRRLLNTCGNCYHAFNNNDPDPTQVDHLMQKIDEMVMMNGGKYYSNEMYENAQRSSIGEIIGAVAGTAVGIAGLVVLALARN